MTTALRFAAENASSGSDDPNVDISGVQDGDAITVTIHANGTDNEISDVTSSSPLTSKPLDDWSPNPANGQTFAVFSGYWHSGDPTTLEFGLGSSNRWRLHALVWSDPDPITIFDVAPEPGNDTGDTGSDTILAPSIDTNTDNAYHVAVGAFDGPESEIIDTPDGYTVAANSGSDTGKQSLATAYKLIATAGATGTASFTNVTNVEACAAFSFAIKANAGGGGGVTLATDSGSYTSTGQAAGLKTARRLSCANGTYALGGQATDLRRGVRVQAALGSYAQAGQAIGFARAVRMPASIGSYAQSGQAATLRAARTLALGAGTLALTGRALAMHFGYRVQFTAGSYAVAGQSLGALRGLRLTLANGFYSLTGEDVTLTFSASDAVLTAAAGTYTVGGQAAGLAVQRKLTAAQGSIVLGGQAVTLRRGVAMLLTPGTYATSGQAIGFERGVRLNLTTGVYVLTGEPVGVLHGNRLALANGAYAAAGQTLTTHRGFGLGAVTGSYAVTGGGLAFTSVRRLLTVRGLYSVTGRDLIFTAQAAPVSWESVSSLITVIDGPTSTLRAHEPPSSRFST